MTSSQLCARLKITRSRLQQLLPLLDSSDYDRITRTLFIYHESAFEKLKNRHEHFKKSSRHKNNT